MKFLDLVFSKYASPFLLLDGYIRTGRFEEFIAEFIDMENERTTWEFYLHKVDNKTFAEFKAEIEPTPHVEPEDIETTVSESMKILNGFIPEQGVKHGTI